MLRLLHEIQGMQVISLAEGRVLGLVQKVFLNPARKAVAGILVRPAGMGKSEGWVDISAVEMIGEDVLFLDRAAAYKAKSPVGRSLKDLMGIPVTTKQGKNLGALVDVEIDESWRVVELSLSEDRTIKIDPTHAIFGQDAILLKAGAEKRVRASGRKRGFLARLFGSETIDDAAEAISRAGRDKTHGGAKSKAIRPKKTTKKTAKKKPAKTVKQSPKGKKPSKKKPAKRVTRKGKKAK